MRFRDKNGPTLYPILKPPDLPDFFAAARRCHFVAFEMLGTPSLGAPLNVGLITTDSRDFSGSAFYALASGSDSCLNLRGC